MRRIIAILVGTLLAVVVAVPAAFAQSQGVPPQEHPLVGASPIVLDPGTFSNCNSPIRLDFSGDIKDLELPGGRFITTSPGLTVTITNLDNGNQKTFSITGASHQTTLGNGAVRTVSTGRSLLGDPEAGLVIAKGNFSFVFNAQGNLVQPLSGQGQLIDICGLVS